MFSSAIFWGSIIILFGLSILIKEIFGINIPIFKILIGLFFIFLGIKFIVGGFNFGKSEKDGQIIFSEGKTYYNENERDYNIIFGRGEIDLTNLPKPDGIEKIEVNVVFGNGVLFLNKETSYSVKSSAAFGSVSDNQNKSSAFGESSSYSSNFDSENYYLIESNAVFGNLKIVQR